MSLDLKRAFETIDRERMQNQLSAIGVTGKELEWFKNFLSGRRQQTKFKGSVSKLIEVPIGLPQGTALSVILFIIYINNITKLKLNGSVILFAAVNKISRFSAENRESAFHFVSQKFNFRESENSRKIKYTAK